MYVRHFSFCFADRYNKITKFNDPFLGRFCPKTTKHHSKIFCWPTVATPQSYVHYVTPRLNTEMALEFRSHKDDAWYDGRLVTEGTAGDRRLRVKFANFSDDQDEVVSAKDLKSLDDVSELRSRVRKLSIQLQDSECSKVEKGLRVCAARSVRNDDRRFYDAFVDEVSSLWVALQVFVKMPLSSVIN